MIVRAGVAAAALLALWMLLALAVAGVGLLCWRRRPDSSGMDGGDLAVAFWTGIAVLLMALQLWHLGAPVGPAAAAIALAASGAGLVRHREGLVVALSAATRRPNRLLAAGVVLLGAWAAHRATMAVATFDTYMYHMPVVQWYREFPLVPGLGNLHGRFAFNNANFLLAALIESVPWRVDSTRVLNGVVLVGFLLHVAARLAAWARHRIPAAPAVFDLVLLVPALAMVNTPELWAGLAPGVPASLALFAAFSLLLAAIYGVPAERAARGRALVVATMLLASAAAIKLNVAGAAVPGWVLAMVLLWRLTRSAPSMRRLPLAAAAAAAVIGAAWVARGVIASGYPLYPSAAFTLPVDWAVPLEQARAEYDWIRLFGHYSFDALAYNGDAWLEFVCTPRAWLGPWLRDIVRPSQLWQLIVPLMLAGGFGALSLTAAATRARLTHAWWLAVPVLVGIAVWWRVAPRLIFGSWAFWLLAAVLAAQAAGAVRPRRTVTAVAAAGVALIAALPLIGDGLEAARRSDGSNIAAAAGTLFVRPPDGALVQPTRWRYPRATYTTDSGLALTVPEGHRCGRAAPPCTSHPARNLELRRPGDLRSGFRVRGAWRAERWPNPWARFLTDWRSTPPCEARP